MPKRDLSAIAEGSSADLQPIQRGRGLTGLLSARSGVALENARRLPLDVINFNPQQARQSFDEDTLEELAESIRHHDVLQPIGVRRLGERYEILFGERRYRAAIAAKKTDIPVLIYDDLSDADAAIMTALENLQREDLELEDEARQFAHLLEVTGLSQRALADSLGKTHNYVSRRVRLLRERPELFAAIREGHLTQKEALNQMAAERETQEVATPDSRVEVYHRDTPAERTPRNEMRPLYSGIPLRWRAITRSYQALGKINPEEVPIEECEDLERQLEDLETLVATTRRALKARIEDTDSIVQRGSAEEL